MYRSDREEFSPRLRNLECPDFAHEHMLSPEVQTSITASSETQTGAEVRAWPKAAECLVWPPVVSGDAGLTGQGCGWEHHSPPALSPTHLDLLRKGPRSQLRHLTVRPIILSPNV